MAGSSKSPSAKVPGIAIRRAYESPGKDDGYRALVDRLWPRGVSKAEIAIDEWCKDVAPSTELRKWFGHVPERFDEFSERYRAELDASDAPHELVERAMAAGSARLTLVYGAKDPEVNHARVLRAYLLERLREG